MKTFIGGLVGALIGMLFCIFVVQLFNMAGATPDFPAYGGESDYSLRFAWFVLAVIPGFLCVGAWIGILFTRQRKLAVFAIAGALGGTLAYTSVLLLFRSIIEALPIESINVAAVAAELAWIVLTGLGAKIGIMISRRS